MAKRKERCGGRKREGMGGEQARKEAVRTTGTQSYYTNLTEVEIRNLRKPLREATPPFPRRTKACVKYFEINGMAKQKSWSRLVWKESIYMVLLLVAPDLYMMCMESINPHYQSGGGIFKHF